MKPAWSQTIQTLLQELDVNPEHGLSVSEVESRLHKYGLNNIQARKKVSRLSLLFKQFHNPVIYVLVFAGVVAFALNEVLDGSAILAIVILNATIGFIQESKAEASIETLAAISSPKGRVLREGRVITVESENICPGDILILEAGDYVVADARIIQARQLATEEAVLTGESLPVDKTLKPLKEDVSLGDRTNMVFASTAISRGTGKALVVATARNTEIGRIADLMESAQNTETPLQKRLEGVSRRLLIAGILVIGLVVLIGLWSGQLWLEILMTALSLSVAAIPEGLPTVVTIALVVAVKRMSRKHALVRKMNAVETLGTADVICTDKTGTLTTGKMKVREVFPVEGQMDLLLKTMVICNNASLHAGGSGDTTEIALLEFAQNNGMDIPLIHENDQRVFEWSFESTRKRMSVAARDDDGITIYVKGAPEAILSRCQMSHNELQQTHEQVSMLSQKGMRVLALASKSEPEQDFTEAKLESIESQLTFLGLVAMADPPRAETIPAIKKCQRAGIRIIMITGDHPQTAASIGSELGIIPSGAKTLTGVELDKLSELELRQVVEEVSIYARVSPENKLNLVNALKANNHIVAMTGDGVNDAPALKTADIGVAMGKGGTEVARQASSLVLTDDNFATIVDAVEEGRAVNGNIKRTLQYLLSTNLAELIFILMSTILGWPVPLLPINLLWLNLVTDGLPSLALAAEPVHESFLEHSKRPSAGSFFDRAFYQEMALVGVLITIMSMGIYFYGLTHFEVNMARSLAFSFIVYTILFRSFSCRSETLTFFEMKPDRNLILAVVLPVIFQLGMQESEFLLRLFKVVPIKIEHSFIILGLSVIPVTFVEVFKIWRRSRVDCK